MFSRILVAVDESPQAAAALDLAIELAKTLSASIVLLHVIDAGSVAAAATEGAATVIEIEIDELQAAGRELLDATSAQVRSAGVAVETMLRDGVPAGTIVDTASRANVDLIVIGTHGRHGVARAFLGSCAEGVLRDSPVPVLVKRS
jgi:nucleotide-binding universal stress UspA family protein